MCLILAGVARKRRARNAAALEGNSGAAYVPHNGYSSGYAGGQNYQQQGNYGGGGGGYQGGYPEPQSQNGAYGYPPPQGPPPASYQQEMVDGNVYAPPTAPPPAYNTAGK